MQLYVRDGYTATAVSKTKRKRVVLSIENKLKIIDLLDQCVSYTVICEKYGIGKSTVGQGILKRIMRRLSLSRSWWIWYHFFFPVLTLASWGVKSSS